MLGDLCQILAATFLRFDGVIRGNEPTHALQHLGLIAFRCAMRVAGLLGTGPKGD